MTTPTWIPGYLGEITIDGGDFSAVGQTLAFNASKNNQSKPTFGTGYMRRVSGMRDATIEVAGHMAAEDPASKLFALFSGTTPFAFTVQLGEAGGDTDGGTITGNALASAFSIEGDADGEWEWSATLQTDGVYAFAPPV